MFTFRRAEPQDAKLLHKLNSAYEPVSPITVDQIQHLLATNPEIVLIGFWNELAIGFVCGRVYESIHTDKKVGEITELFIRDHYRRNSEAFGTKLLNAIEAELSAHDVSCFTLEVDQTNIPAVKLYEKRNYTKKWSANKRRYIKKC